MQISIGLPKWLDVLTIITTYFTYKLECCTSRLNLYICKRDLRRDKLLDFINFIVKISFFINFIYT